MELEQHLETTVKAHDQMLHRRVDLLLRTGKVLVESLADTNRIMRNMKRTAAYLGIPEEKLHINISFTMLMVNVSDENFSFTKFQRINGHGVNMSAISEISKLSWRAIENDYTLDQYEEELEKIRAKKRNYTRRSGIIHRCRRLSVPDSRAADSVCSSDAIGWRSCMPRLRLSSACGSARSAMSRG